MVKSRGVPSAVVPPSEPMGKRTKRMKILCVVCGCDEAHRPTDGSAAIEIALCECCEEFSRAVGKTPLQVQRIMKMSPKVFEKFQENAQEFRSTANNEGQYHKEEVWEETRQVSMLQETFAFRSREEFKSRHGCTPDDLKMCLIRVQGSKGEVTGVAIKIETAEPTLVVRTEKHLIHRKPIKTASEHRFKSQMVDHFAARSADWSQHFGQTCGNKYKAKLKSGEAYTEEEIAELLHSRASTSSHAEPSAIHSLMAVGDVEDDDGVGEEEVGEEEAEKEEEAEETDEKQPEAFGTPVGKRERSRDGAKNLLASVGGRDRRMLMVKNEPGTSSEGPCRSTPTRDGGLKRSRSGLLRLTSPGRRSDNSGTPTSQQAGELDFDGARRKPPEYWKQAATVDIVWSGKNIANSLRFAKKCLERLISSGDSPNACDLKDHLELVENASFVMDAIANPSKSYEEMLPSLGNLAKANCDFPLVIKSKLLGKYLNSKAKALAETEARDLDQIIRTLSPFSTEAGMPDGVCEDAGSSEGQATSEKEECGMQETSIFDPANPRLCSIGDSLDNRGMIAQKILMSDIVKVLVSMGEEGLTALSALSAKVVGTWEEGVEALELVPPAILDTLVCFRYLAALCDSTALDLDFAAIESFELDRKEKRKGILWDLSCYLMGNDYFKERVDILAEKAPAAMDMLPKIKGKVAQVLAQACELDDDFTNTLATAFEVIKEARVALRPGSAWHLESACRNLVADAVSKCHGGEDGWQLDGLQTANIKNLTRVLELSREVFTDNIDHNDLVASLGDVVTRRLGAIQFQLILDILESIVENNREITDDDIKDLETRMSERDDIPIAGEFAKRLLEMLEVVADRCLQDFPKNARAADTFATCLAAAEESKEKKALMAKLNLLSQGADLQDALDRHKDLGLCMKARWEADQDDELVRALVCARTKFSKPCGDVWEFGLTASQFPGIRSLVEAVTEHITVAADMKINQLTDSLVRAHASTKDWCKGGKRMEPWHAQVPDSATFAEVSKVAQRTLLSKSPDRYKQTREGIASDMGELTKYAELFSREVPLDLAQDINYLCKSLNIAYFEGLLLALYNSVTDKDTLKIKTHNIKKQLIKCQLFWTDIYDKLRSRADDALRLR